MYFFRADANALLADLGARLLFNLPYTPALMSSEQSSDGTIVFRSRRTLPPVPDATYVATFKPGGNPTVPPDGSRTAFLRNRDYAFAPGHGGRMKSLSMLHDPWMVEEVNAQIQVNTVLNAAGLDLPTIPLAFDFTREIAAVCWNPVDVALT